MLKQCVDLVQPTPVAHRNVREFLNQLVPANLSVAFFDYSHRHHNSNKIEMENNKQVEVIFFSKYSLRNSGHKEQLRWLGTIAQSAIEVQNEKAKKLFLKILKGTPAIYLS